ncbi:MAG: hypothetical protein ACOZQL_21200 [Myxococcota bacterium]
MAQKISGSKPAVTSTPKSAPAKEKAAASTPKQTPIAKRFGDDVSTGRTMALKKFFNPAGPAQVFAPQGPPPPVAAPEPIQTQLIHKSERVKNAQAAIDQKLEAFQQTLNAAHPLLNDAQKRSAMENFRAENAALYTELENAKRDLVSWATENKTEIALAMKRDTGFARSLAADLASVAGSTSNAALLQLVQDPAIAAAFSADPTALQTLRDDVLAPAMQGLALESLATSPNDPVSALAKVEQTLGGLQDLYDGLTNSVKAVSELKAAALQGPAALAKKAVALADDARALGKFGNALGAVAAFFSFAMAGQNAASGDYGAAAKSLVDGLSNAEQLAKVAQLAAQVVTKNPTALANVVKAAPVIGSVFAVAGAVIDTLNIDGSRPSTLVQAAGSWAVAGATILAAAGVSGPLAPAMLVVGIGAQFFASSMGAAEQQAELRRVLGALKPPLPPQLIDGIVAYGGQRVADGFRSVTSDPQQIAGIVQRMTSAAARAYPNDPAKAADLMRRYLEVMVRTGGNAEALRRELEQQKMLAQPFLVSPRPGESAGPNVEFAFWELAGKP